ncbi:MAG: hypothetical protein WCC92_02645 [Candidatus Korobacteraceae bacterium]
MIKVFRFVAVCTISAVFAISSIAWAQSYTTVDYPGATATTLNGGPNPQGTAVGTWTDSSGVAHGLTYNNNAKRFTSFDPPGSVGTTPNFITPEGVIVGSYLDSAGVLHGFTLTNGHYQTVNYPGAAGTSLDGINPLGEIVGFECEDQTCTNFHSFTRSVTGRFTSFDPPGAAISEPATINLLGVIVGGWWTVAPPANPNLHGYMLFNGRYTTIDFPGTTSGTFCGGNNLQNDIVGQWIDSGGAVHSFLLKNGHYTSFDPPGATGGDVATGINVFDVIVGLYVDSAGKEHGYVRTP